ncbi:MAG: hypothetical protein L6R41_004274 [Letrouitia leprolyta]|nr:MAG: hypothetical protein L6R41_004274 [Letrouitia leprolyta]
MLPNPEKRKLRASCDSCYLAKVKCTKETPTCSRCLDHNTMCKYSPSQRTGKPRRVSTDVQEKSPSLPVNDWGWSTGPTAWNPGDKLAHQLPLLAGDPELSTLGVRNLEDLSLQTLWQPSSANDTLHDEIWSDNPSRQPSFASSHRGFSSTDPAFEVRNGIAVPATPKSAGAALGQQDTRRYLDHTKSTAEDHISFLNPVSLTLDTLTSHSKPPDPEIFFQKPSCTCSAQTFEILRTLHERSGSPSTPFDTILAINKDVNSRISATLDCPFQHDFSTIMTLLASIARILAWYRSIFFPASFNTSAATWPVAGESATTPISLGAYQLDGEDEKGVKIQVALNELKKVDALLARIPSTQDGSSDKSATKVMAEDRKKWKKMPERLGSFVQQGKQPLTPA